MAWRRGLHPISIMDTCQGVLNRSLGTHTRSGEAVTHWQTSSLSRKEKALVCGV